MKTDNGQDIKQIKEDIKDWINRRYSEVDEAEKNEWYKKIDLMDEKTTSQLFETVDYAITALGYVFEDIDQFDPEEDFNS